MAAAGTDAGLELVRTTDDDDDDDADEEEGAWLRDAEPAQQQGAATGRLRRLLTEPLTPDEVVFRRRGVVVPAAQVRLAKFAALSYGLVVGCHAWIRARKSTTRWERDAAYTLADFHLLDLHPCALDLMWFFVVGRLWRRRGVDSVAFAGPCVVGAWLFSAVGSWDFTRHSISLYAVRCVWPASLFFFFAGLLVVVAALVCLHVAGAARRGVVCARLGEIGATIAIFWWPRWSDGSFHVHHWFLSWFVGQHANQDEWWSVASAGVLWGGYVNGVAVYGRDDPLGCKAAYYAASDLRCGFMACVNEAYYVAHNTSVMPAPAASFDAPDWRHCGRAGNYAP